MEKIESPSRDSKESQEKGTRQCIWLPAELFQKTEHLRKRLGLGKSQFYRYCIIELLKQFELFIDERHPEFPKE